MIAVRLIFFRTLLLSIELTLSTLQQPKNVVGNTDRITISSLNHTEISVVIIIV